MKLKVDVIIELLDDQKCITAISISSKEMYIIYHDFSSVRMYLEWL